MAYSLEADIQSEFKDIDFADADSKVSSAEVSAFIVQSDAFIDSKVGLRYEVPITGTESLKILKTISIWLVADRVSKILRIKSNVPETETAEKSLRDMALEMLEDIAKGVVLLSDATVKSSGSGFSSYANSEDLGYTFKKEETQW